MKFAVAYVGNFEPAFSTETDIAWTLEQLGWRVLRLQENRSQTEEWMIAANDADFLLWTHTHGWGTPGRISIEEVLAKLAERRIPTVGIHLDRYFGLPERELMMSTHPFFKCSQLWTADGGNQEKFALLNINHFWMPPAVCLRHCYLGEKKPYYEADVCFVGSGRGYHPEYSFRSRLVQWLDDPHEKFTVRRWGGDRPGARAELNDIYASCKIVVGDSIFAGSPRYFSDRVYETQGRGGFLAHPKCDGMDVTGMADYKPQDLADLNDVILYYLDNQERRESMRMFGYEHTRKNHTYHNRIITILNHLEMN